MVCGDCFHCSVCGSSSPYNDVSQCKQFIRKDSIVSVEKFNDLKSKRDRYEMLYHEALRSMEDFESELKQLRLIKQTLEMASGLKFDF